MRLQRARSPRGVAASSSGAVQSNAIHVASSWKKATADDSVHEYIVTMHSFNTLAVIFSHISFVCLFLLFNIVMLLYLVVHIT